MAIAETVLWAGMFYSFPALLLTWETDLGWSKTTLSGAFTLSLVIFAILAPFVGRLIDQGLGRWVLVFSAVFGAASLVGLSFVTTVWQFYLAWAALGVAMACGLYEACFSVITYFTGERARRAITLVTLVAGLAGTVSFPLVHALTRYDGWRLAVLALAALQILIAAPLCWIGIGAANKLQTGREHHTRHAPIRSGSVLGKGLFWLLAITYGAMALDHGLLLTHLLPLLDEKGVQASVAVLAAAMIGPMQVTGRVVMMMVERWVSMQAIAVGSLIAMAIAAASLLGVAGGLGLLVVFVVVHGAGYGVTSIARPVITAEFLGRENFGQVSGMLAMPYWIVIAVAPTLAALLWESGGYDVVIIVALCATIVGLVAMLLASRIHRRS